MTSRITDTQLDLAKTICALHPNLKSRTIGALTLIDSDALKPSRTRALSWTCKSAKFSKHTPITYHVHLGPRSCSCPDTKRHAPGGWCKHQIAAAIVSRAAVIDAATAERIEKLRDIQTQAWMDGTPVLLAP